jgi:hypothetical protein
MGIFGSDLMPLQAGAPQTMKMRRAAASWCEGRFLINTPLQWGAWVPVPRPNRFNGF